MSANTALRISELDFDSIRSNLKTFLQSQSEFVDYDFEGSGMSVLLDILAYNTHYMGYYLNMVGNEMFLDTAQLRSSVVSHAKHIDYVPSSKKGAEARVTITVTPSGGEDNVATTATLARGTRLISEPVDGVSYIFATTSANTVIKTSNKFTFSNVVIRQGEPITQRYLANGQRRFNIPSMNVDTDTITVSVQESSSNTTLKVYSLADDITELTANTQAFFIEEGNLSLIHI